MGIGKKIFFFYCFFVTSFITVSAIASGIQNKNPLLALLFFPVIFYFIFASLRLKRSKEVTFNARKSEILILGILFLVLFGVGFSRIYPPAGLPRQEKKLIVHVPSPSPVASKKETITVLGGKGISYINIRKDATASARIIGKAYKGDNFESPLKKNGWFEIILKDGSLGWISADFVVGGSK